MWTQLCHEDFPSSCNDKLKTSSVPDISFSGVLGFFLANSSVPFFYWVACFPCQPFDVSCSYSSLPGGKSSWSIHELLGAIKCHHFCSLHRSLICWCATSSATARGHYWTFADCQDYKQKDLGPDLPCGLQANCCWFTGLI